PESLSSLQAEVAILTKLVNDLHQLSQSDRGALAYRKTQLDVVRLLQVAIASFHGRFQNKKMTITAHLPEHAVIFGDPDRLNQLFHNLLENSLRYTNEGGH
ncbi:sensor histidine kinase BaeS, partial [Yersinia pestis PY-89]